jgi:hypothetical protein
MPMLEEFILLLLIALIFHRPLIWVCKKVVDEISCTVRDVKAAFKSKK